MKKGTLITNIIYIVFSALLLLYGIFSMRHVHSMKIYEMDTKLGSVFSLSWQIILPVAILLWVIFILRMVHRAKQWSRRRVAKKDITESMTITADGKIETASVSTARASERATTSGTSHKSSTASNESTGKTAGSRRAVTTGAGNATAAEESKSSGLLHRSRAASNSTSDLATAGKNTSVKAGERGLIQPKSHAKETTGGRSGANSCAQHEESAALGDFKLCAYCGAKIDAKAKFCKECGRKVEEE